jgi:hypothetical protein
VGVEELEKLVELGVEAEGGGGGTGGTGRGRRRRWGGRNREKLVELGVEAEEVEAEEECGVEELEELVELGSRGGVWRRRRRRRRRRRSGGGGGGGRGGGNWSFRTCWTHWTCWTCWTGRTIPLIWIRRNIPDRDRKQDYAWVMYWGHCYRSYSTPAYKPSRCG